MVSASISSIQIPGNKEKWSIRNYFKMNASLKWKDGAYLLNSFILFWKKPLEGTFTIKMLSEIRKQIKEHGGNMYNEDIELLDAAFLFYFEGTHTQVWARTTMDWFMNGRRMELLNVKWTLLWICADSEIPNSGNTFLCTRVVRCFCTCLVICMC